VTFAIGGENARLRAAPTTTAETLDSIPAGATIDVIGRLGDNSWVQVNYNGRSGWVAGFLGSINGDINVVPVTG
jgi:uncharacterized protein YraI